MIGSRLLPAAVLVVLVLAETACGGGGGGESTKQVTKSELASMVLPRSAFGTQAATLRVRRVFGFEANAQAARQHLDPRVTAASLTEAGRLTGYASAYTLGQAQAESALSRGAGLMQLGTVVDLYRTNAAAASQLSMYFSDCRALVGKRIKSGARLKSCAGIRLPRLGDGARGFTLEAEVRGIHVYDTEVLFRLGRLLALASEERADSENADATVVALAHALESRIGRALETNGRAAKRSAG